jgi:3-oxoacyl-[acyl-carrier protein] reductase
MAKLDGKVAVVTGASQGIGASIALHLAAEGASVVVNDASSKEGADRVVSEISGKGGKALGVQANRSDPADIRRLSHERRAGIVTRPSIDPASHLAVPLRASEGVGHERVPPG